MGRNNWFQFKQFKIIQEKTAMKVGTDGVLLGAWVNISGAKTILDVGAGTGIIALMLVQRSPAKITGIEIKRCFTNNCVINGLILCNYRQYLRQKSILFPVDINFADFETNKRTFKQKNTA